MEPRAFFYINWGAYGRSRAYKVITTFFAIFCGMLVIHVLFYLAHVYTAVESSRSTLKSTPPKASTKAPILKSFGEL
jgi:hypothetical protein